jgi:hypothetical protein
MRLSITMLGGRRGGKKGISDTTDWAVQILLERRNGDTNKLAAAGLQEFLPRRFHSQKQTDTNRLY